MPKIKDEKSERGRKGFLFRGRVRVTEGDARVGVSTV
jgi:hypothetical protein